MVTSTARSTLWTACVLIGFDNERGKGDHCHLHGQELPYNFTTVDALVEDFIAAVDAARRTP